MSSEEFQYRVLTATDYDEVKQLMNDQFLPRNPLARAAGETTVEVLGEELLKDLRKSVESGVSLGVCAADGRLVGFRLSFIVTRGEGVHEGTPISKSYKILKQMSEGVDFFKDKDVNKVLILFAITVHADLAGKGIGSTLIKKTLALAEEKGCQLATTKITNVRTDKIYSRMGFQVISTLDLCTVPGFNTSLIPGETLFKVIAGRLPISV